MSESVQNGFSMKDFFSKLPGQNSYILKDSWMTQNSGVEEPLFRTLIFCLIGMSASVSQWSSYKNTDKFEPDVFHNFCDVAHTEIQERMYELTGTFATQVLKACVSCNISCKELTTAPIFNPIPILHNALFNNDN